MTLYGFALFLHVVLAILLVGGSSYAHVTTTLVARARTVDGVRSHVEFLHAFAQASGPLAAGVLLAGVYLAFDGEWWGTGWPAVSLVLFLMAGVAAFAVIVPKTQAARELLAETPDGPMTPELGARLADPTLVWVSWLMAGADLALVFLMTNKPGFARATLAAVVGLALGAAMGWREVRHARAAAPPVGPAAPDVAT